MCVCVCVCVLINIYVWYSAHLRKKKTLVGKDFENIFRLFGW